jgi:DNA-binding response OmpR family regulator
MKVMVVEDEPDVRELVRLTLEAEGGFTVDECGAPDALLAVERNHPDLVLLDVMMPGVDGVSLARELRGRASTRDVAIVFLTACLRPGDIAGYADLGARDVIAKPFDPRKLGARLRTALSVPAGDPDPETAREGIGRGYRLELDDRIREIEQGLAEVAALTPAVAREVALLAHRLAGSAAIFGMNEVSEAARALEDALGRFLIEDAGAFGQSIQMRVGDLRRRVADATRDS